MPLQNIPASTLAVAAAAQRAAYKPFDGAAPGVLGSLLSSKGVLGGWTAAFADQSGIFAFHNFLQVQPWSITNGYYESNRAAAFAALSQDGQTLVVAFRGSNSLIDGLPDLALGADFVQSAIDLETQLRALHPFIESIIDLVRSGGIGSVVVTGHSLGGEIAKAFLAVYGDRLTQNIEIDNSGTAIAASAISLVTFGSPGMPVGLTDIDSNGDGFVEGRREYRLSPQISAFALGNSNDPVFEHAGLLAVGLAGVPSELVDDRTQDVVVNVADDLTYNFDRRGDAQEHDQRLYQEAWTDIAISGWYGVWSSASAPVYALRTDTVSVYDPPYDFFDFIQRKSFAPNDVVVVPAGTTSSTFLGLAGDDRITIESFATVTFFVSGGEGNDTISGGSGADYLDGGFGLDSLRGGGGNDRLWGGPGYDNLSGGAGSDFLYGGAGNDTAIFEQAFSQYRLSRESGTGIYLVTHPATGDVDRLEGFELLQFGAATAQSIDSFNWTGGTSPPPPPPSTVPPPSQPPPPPTPGDDYGNTAATAHSISSSALLAGRIEVLGDQDWFAVTLLAGARYSFAMAGGSYGGVSLLPSPHLYLRNSLGDLLGHGAPVSTNSIFQFTAGTTGTYYLQARSHGDQATGTYGLSVVQIGAAPPPPPPPPGPVSLDLDAVENILPEDGTQLIYHVEYHGALTEDIVIGWTLVPTGDYPIDSLDVVQMSGQVTLQSTDDDGHVTIRVNPQTDQVDEENETFELQISVISGGATITDNDAWGTIVDDDEGNIIPDVDEHSNSFVGATPTVETVWYRGFVTTPGDLDFFALNVVAGATYKITILGDDDTSLIGGTETGFISLADPQGALYDNNFNQVTGQFLEPVNQPRRADYEFTAASTGAYFIAVRADGNNDIGQYFVRTNVINHADDYAGDASTSAVLIEGQLGVARNERIGDVDWFRVELTAGQTYSLFAIATGWNGNFIWPGDIVEFEVRVRNAAGDSLAGATEPAGVNDGQYNQVTFTPASTGIYYLSVADPNSTNGDEPYVVGFQSVAPPPATTPVVFQLGPNNGLDASFRDVQTQSEPGIDNDSLVVGGFWGGNGSSASAIRFDLNGLPAEASHAYVEIYLYGVTLNGASTTRAPTTMLLGALTAAWDETSPYTAIRDYQREDWLSAPSGPGWYRFEITDLYNAWQGGSLANYGFSLLPVDHHTTNNLFYSSDYAGDPSLRPRLIVHEATPSETIGTNAFDNIRGTARSDWLSGLDGDDLISAEGGNDFVDGGAGADILNGGDGYDLASYLNSPEGVHVNLGENEASGGHAAGDSLLNVENVNGSALSDTLIGDAGANVLGGNGSGDQLYGAGGSDTLDGGVGADQMFGGAGDDFYVVDNGTDTITELAGEGDDTVQSSVSYALSADAERLNLTGSALNGTGNSLDNIIVGNGANNILDGLAGADTMFGGAGNDTYNVDNIGDVTSEDVGAGTDLVRSSVSRTLDANIENLTLLGGAGLGGTGNELNNLIVGNIGANTLSGLDGNDTLNGGAGADVLIGGAGNDVYVVDNAGDVVTEASGEGTDLIQSLVTRILGANVENLSLFGALAINGTGNELANVLIGNGAANTLSGLAGADTLNGGLGADTMFGGAGDDIYVVDDAGDVTFEGSALDGVDAVQSSITRSLGANLENLTLTGIAAITGAGNSLNNIITGNGAANTLFGNDGDDTLNGGNGNDILQGGAGNDTLNGGQGADSMFGGAGNDSYIVDAGGDITFEGSALDGTDIVFSSVTRALGPNLENLTLTGTAAINGGGNELANILIGNNAANALYGNGGADTLDGGVGADRMFGGAGDDIYVVDNAGDITVEGLAIDGTDLVLASVTRSLGANLENLTLTGSAAINGIGNSLANIITGNSGANQLFGNLGDDVLAGGAGNDLLAGGAGNDRFVFAPGSGSDTVTTFLAGGVDDSLDFSAYAGTGITWTITQVGANTVFDFSNGDQITLTNVTAANLVQTDPFGYG